MRRNLAEPGYPGVAERGTRVEAAGDGASDERPSLLGQQPEHPLLRRHQRIQPRRLAVEVGSDGALLMKTGAGHFETTQQFSIELLRSVRRLVSLGHQPTSDAL